MGYISFGVGAKRRENYIFSYTTRLHLDPPEYAVMGWDLGDMLVVDHTTCTIRIAQGWECGPRLARGAGGSLRALFQCVEPGIHHQNEKRRHCRRLVLDPKNGIVRAGEIDDSLNKATFEKRHGKRCSDGRKQTIWKPSRKAQEALYVNRVNRGLRGTARDFKNWTSQVKQPEIKEEE